MPIFVYHILASPPCRAVFMTAETLGIEIVKKELDFFTGELRKPEYLAISPQQTVPAMDDNGFILWESRAIAKYMVNQYKPDSPLYPKDPEARALVDQMLDFDHVNIFKPLLQTAFARVVYKIPPNPEWKETVMKAVAILEKLFEKTPYVAGNHMTLADYWSFSNLVHLNVVYDFSYADYPKVTAWLEKMKKESPKYKEIHEESMEEFKTGYVPPQ